ncbi:MAG: hypothetical protein ACRDJG_04345, partial [Actinomycetota bacterium]
SVLSPSSTSWAERLRGGRFPVLAVMLLWLAGTLLSLWLALRPRDDAGRDKAYSPPILLGRVGSPWISESSGLASSQRNPGLLWTHNDSGDGAYLYCLDLKAHACGVWFLDDAGVVDWEGIALGPGPHPNTPYLYIGDTGDRPKRRGEVTIYRFREPRVTADATGSTKQDPKRIARPTAITLRYPGEPHHAEAVMVHPVTGAIYLITEDAPEPGSVYRATPPFVGPGPHPLTLAGRLRLPEPEGASVTGGDISADGQRVAISTYEAGYEFELPKDHRGSFDAIWRRQPLRIKLGPRKGSRAIAYTLDGKGLLTTSERPPALYEVLRQED